MTPLLEPLEKSLWNLQWTAAQFHELFGECRMQTASRLIDAARDEERVLFNAVPGGVRLVDSTGDMTTQLSRCNPGGVARRRRERGSEHPAGHAQADAAFCVEERAPWQHPFANAPDSAETIENTTS